MKQIKFLVIVAALMVCSTASAQFTSSSRSGSSSVSTEGWNTFYFMYSPTTLKDEYKEKSFSESFSYNLSGFSLGYERAIGLTQSIPLYLKVGGELKYSFGKKSFDEDRVKYDIKYSFLSVKVPVSVAYDFAVTDNIDILPYTGMFFRVNAMGKVKYDGDYSKYLDDDDYDVFSDGDDDEKWSRFQVGWQIGADVMFSKRFVAGINYSNDISKLYNEDGEKVSSHAINIKLGIVF